MEEKEMFIRNVLKIVEIYLVVPSVRKGLS